MGSKAVEKFRSLHPSHHLLLSSLSVRLTALEKRAGDKRKKLNRLKSVNSPLAAENQVGSKSQAKPYDRKRLEKTQKRRGRGQKTVLWSQQLVKVNVKDFLCINSNGLKSTPSAGSSSQPLASDRESSATLSH